MNTLSNISLKNTLLNAAKKNRSNYSELMVKISSGQKYLLASESPTECNQVTTMTNTLEKVRQWAGNAETAMSFETATSSTLGSMTDIMNNVNELIVEMNSGTLESGDYENIATQFNELIESLVTAGNIRYGNVELFAGTRTGADPFSVSRDTAGNIVSVSFLNGETATPRKISISSGESIRYGITGDKIFNYQSYEHDEDTDKWSNIDVNLFDTLINMRDSLNSGELPSDTLCKRAEAGLANVISQYVHSSSSQAKFEMIFNSLQSAEDSMGARISDISSLDMAAATVELSAYETALEASYRVLAGVNSISLLDYI